MRSYINNVGDRLEGGFHCVYPKLLKISSFYSLSVCILSVYALIVACEGLEVLVSSRSRRWRWLMRSRRLDLTALTRKW